ncbi:MAG: hypothetical protein JNK65_02795 [Deltaproteobacteria bacterium]|nr:hypothetical protein [Deltaproteobacteria bacterium]
MKLTKTMKLILFFVMLSLGVPQIALPCNAKKAKLAPAHSCCKNQQLCKSEVKKAPCCNSCKREIPPPASATGPVLSAELDALSADLPFISLLPIPKKFHLCLQNHQQAHAPPRLLLSQSFLS